MNQPLEGIRIIDFSHMQAGPFSTMIMAAMGAEVIKIESMQHIDPYRRASLEGVDMSFGFNEFNLGKKSVRLNLRQPRAVELAKRLIAGGDATVVNMRPGVIDRLGLGYEAQRQVRSDIIMAHISYSGWADGPERNYAGYAGTFSAIGGAAHISGHPDGPPTEDAVTGWADCSTGVWAATALLAALQRRELTGEGAFLDISAREGVAAFIPDVLLDYILTARVAGRSGNGDTVMAPHNCYPSKGEDRWVSIAVGSDAEWTALCQTMGNPAWAEDARFATVLARWQHQDELDRLIGTWTVDLTAAEVTERLQAAGVASAPSYNSRELHESEHLSQRDFWVTVDHPFDGKQTKAGLPWRYSRTPTSITEPSPWMGQHTEEVLRDLLGLSGDEISRLVDEGVAY